MSEANNESSGKPKSGCLKSGCLGLAVLAAISSVPFYFICLHTPPLKISPETTFITEPLSADGYPDYFGAYQKLWEPKLSPPEENGQRDIIIACGPAALEQSLLVKTVPWAEFPTNAISKQWYDDYYVPLCKAMDIDPAAEPKYLHSLCFFDYMRYKNEDEQSPSEKAEYAVSLQKILAETPCKAADEPDTAAWLKERSPLLDIFGTAVRKENFACWRKQSENTMWSILLPDVQNNRNYVRDLQIRIAERLGRNDVDGAWYDTMSIWYAARHYLQKEIMVERLVGAAYERIAAVSVKLILQDGKASKEQLAKFAADLESLPDRWQPLYFDLSFERMCIYDAFFFVKRDGLPAMTVLLDGTFRDTKSAAARFVPFASLLDANVCLQRITYYTAPISEASKDIKTMRQKLKEYAAMIDVWVAGKSSTIMGIRGGILLPKYRSIAFADIMLSLTIPGLNAYCDAAFAGGTVFDLTRIAIALERYKLDNAEYPDTPDKLVPQYLPAVPVDMFTGGALKFSPNTGDAGGYKLYSVGSNEIDDGGVNDSANKKDDIVW